MFRKEVLIGSLSQLLGVAFNLAIIPLIFNKYSISDSGVYNFYGSLVALVALVDVGMSTSVLRLSGEFYSEKISFKEFRNKFGAFHLLFVRILFLLIIVLGLFKDVIIDDWVTSSGFSVKSIFFVMLLSLPFKFIQSLYRGVLNGMQKVLIIHYLVIGNLFARFLLPLFVLYFFSIDIFFLFTWFLFISLVETLVLIIVVNRFVKISSDFKLFRGLSILKDELSTIIPVSVASIVWALSVQFDKIILNAQMNSLEYGLISPGFVLAGGILLISGPITKSILPRMTVAASSGRTSRLKALFEFLSNFFSVLVVAIYTLSILLSTELFEFWLGDSRNLDKTVIVFLLFLLGNSIALINSVAYYYQLAKNDLILHRNGHIFLLIYFVLFTIPSIYHFSYYGAALSWIIGNIIYNRLVVRRINLLADYRDLYGTIWVFFMGMLLIMFFFKDIFGVTMIRFISMIMFIVNLFRVNQIRDYARSIPGV